MTQSERPYPPIYPRIFWATQRIMRFLILTLTRFHVEGLENVPADGGLVVVANHLHHLDTPALGAIFPRLTYVLAGEKYERHIFALILWIAGAIYINRGEPDRKALRQALAVLEDGHALAVAAEGTRSRTGQLQKAKTGAAYLATRANVPLIPVVVWGTENIISSWARLKRADVYVQIGEPFRLPEGHARSQQLEAYTDEIMTTLASMLPERYWGVYRDHPLLEQKRAAQVAEG